MTRVSFSLLSSQSCWFLVAEEAKTTVLTGMWLQACVVVVVAVFIIVVVTVVIVIVVIAVVIGIVGVAGSEIESLRPK